MTGDITSHYPELTGGHGEHVIPVTADTQSLGRHIASSQLDTVYGRKGRWQQAALQDVGRRSFHLGLARLDGPRHSVGHNLEHLGVLSCELLSAQPADVEHTEDLPAAQQGHPQHGANALSPKDRVRDSGVVDAVQCDGPLLGGDASRKAPSQRHPDALADLFLDSAGCTCLQLVGPLIEQEDGRRVGHEDVAHPVEQLDQHVVGVQLPERHVRDRPYVPEPICRHVLVLGSWH